MAFISGPISFQRYFCTGPLPAEINDKFIAALEAKTFGKIAAQADETQFGWIGPRHLFETEIDGEALAFGRFAHLGFRCDRLKIPSPVLKAYIRMEEQAALQSSGREFLSRVEKRRAKDAALLRAEQEAKDGRFRRMSAYPVLIDLENRTAYLGNLGAAVGGKFMQLFADTFGAALEPADPERVATRLMLAAKNSRALENLPPSRLVAPPEDYDRAGTDLGALSLNFLGKEFLTWLWYQTEVADEPIHLRKGDEISVMIANVIRLKCDYGLGGTNAIAADAPARLPEARAALSGGKQPTKMGLILGSPLGEFRLALDGPRLVVSSLILPEDEPGDDLRARFEQRFERVADVCDLLDALFEFFLLKRTNREWNAELRKMAEWAGGDTPALKLKTG